MAAAALPLLAQIFPVKDGVIQDAGKLISEFDFSKINVKDETSQDFLHCDLAPSFGKLTSESVQKLDDEMKIMIAGLTKQLGDSKDRSWEGIVALCAQSPFLESSGDGVNVNDSLIKKSSSSFKTDGSPNDSIVREVETWFKGKINDPDILNSTKIDITVLGRIVAQTGATVDDFVTFFVKHEAHSQTILDIGVLRYPDIDNPYFKIYRINVSAWSDCTRTVWAQDDCNGIQLEFNSRNYKPRSDTISRLKESARAEAIDFANNLFSR